MASSAAAISGSAGFGPYRLITSPTMAIPQTHDDTYRSGISTETSCMPSAAWMSVSATRTRRWRIGKWSTRYASSYWRRRSAESVQAVVSGSKLPVRFSPSLCRSSVRLQTAAFRKPKVQREWQEWGRLLNGCFPRFSTRTGQSVSGPLSAEGISTLATD
jgi:hypothetical protein